MLLCATPVATRYTKQFSLITALRSAKSLHCNEIYNTSKQYESQISTDSKTEAEFDSSDCGSSHVDHTALGEVTVSENGTEGENKGNEHFLWGKYGMPLSMYVWDKEKHFVMFPDHKVM
jgi:hypothetical protein